jgi:hypothetical protein
MAALLVAVVVGIAACGDSGEASDDAAAVEETIVASANSESPADCERLHTEDFLERMSAGFEGDAALRLCEEVIEEDLGEDPREVTVADVQVEGDEATANASFAGSSLDGQTVTIALVREEGGWKIDRMVEFAEFDRDRLLDGLKQEVRELDSSALEAELGTCMAERLGALDDSELQDLALYNDPDGIRGIVEVCLRAAEGDQDL